MSIMRSLLRTALIASFATLTGCGAFFQRGSDALRHPMRENCLVLSAGGPAGIAHLGAIEALRAAHVPINCVVGTSMGAVVGSLYATDPSGDTTARYVRFATEYERVTRAEADSSGGLFGVLGALVGAATGGVGSIVLGAMGGYAVGASSVTPIAHQRFVHVLDGQLDHATIERLPMSFVTMHQERAENSLRMVVDRSGSLATAVGASAANPFIFSDLNPRSMQQLDPAADRLAAVPIGQACEEHPGARLIVINVMGDSPPRLADQSCEVLEVQVRIPSGVDLRAAIQPGPVFRQVVEVGRSATASVLSGYDGP